MKAALLIWVRVEVHEMWLMAESGVAHQLNAKPDMLLAAVALEAELKFVDGGPSKHPKVPGDSTQQPHSIDSPQTKHHRSGSQILWLRGEYMVV